MDKDNKVDKDDKDNKVDKDDEVEKDNKVDKDDERRRRKTWTRRSRMRNFFCKNSYKDQI